MDKLTVLITTSGLGSRLGEKSKFINKALLRVGDLPIISHIIQSYKQDTEFIITTGYKGDLIRQYLNIAHGNLNIKIVEVDKFDGEGSSLLYSMVKAKMLLQKPFVYHVSDAIIWQNSNFDFNHNFIVGSKKGDPTYYSSFIVSGSEVKSIHNKGELRTDFNYVGVANIFDYNFFWHEAEQLLQKQPTNSSLNDVFVFDLMLKNKLKIKFCETNQWYDTGSLKGLAKANEIIKSKILNEVLDKPKESIFYSNNEIIKFFSDSNVNLNRVKRAGILHPIVPKITESSNNFYKYKLVDGDLLSKVITPELFYNFLEYSNKKLWKKVKSNLNLNELCKAFYLEKTLIRVNEFLNKKNINDKSNHINGYKVPKISDLIKKIPQEFYENGTTSKVHGDFILDNCIKTKNSFKMIDWRQDFGGNTELGDLYYDLSKLAHNLVVNHEMIDNNFYFVDYNKDKINVEIFRKNNLVECEKIYYKWLEENKFDMKRIKLLRAIIWINMSPLHHKPFDEFLFYFGKLNLFNALKEYD